MSSATPNGARPDLEWTAEQVMAWMDSFRELILHTAEGADRYERLRRADPMRQVNLKAAG